MLPDKIDRTPDDEEMLAALREHDLPTLLALEDLVVRGNYHLRVAIGSYRALTYGTDVADLEDFLKEAEEVEELIKKAIDE